ncbi:MAG TPA: MerR family transcriptional regulator [Jatrophihabitantaceae bacterium]|jgi:DNA-binding transcriptional MerR regulator|nr:MerR family transcriptional regulator [Jatrophihabitantaceae bacterium]
MFTIGDFARHGRVSVRMLRHYDGLGLLRPARVDEFTGYRYYEARQLTQLNRIVALRDLGFGMEQIATMLDDRVGIDELRGMLRLRRAELEASLDADRERLARVEARLRTIESEGRMPTEEIVVKKLDTVRVAELQDTAASFTPEDIAPVIRPLCADLGERLHAASFTPAGHLLAYYEQRGGRDDEVVIHAAIPIAGATDDTQGTTVVDLPAVARAATIVHRGSMNTVLSTVDALVRWIDAHGYEAVGYARELYLECPDDESRWVTEIQQPIA